VQVGGAEMNNRESFSLQKWSNNLLSLLDRTARTSHGSLT
jgi:hypothetical protein